MNALPIHRPVLVEATELDQGNVSLDRAGSHLTDAGRCCWMDADRLPRFTSGVNSCSQQMLMDRCRFQCLASLNEGTALHPILSLFRACAREREHLHREDRAGERRLNKSR